MDDVGTTTAKPATEQVQALANISRYTEAVEACICRLNVMLGAVRVCSV